MITGEQTKPESQNEPDPPGGDGYFQIPIEAVSNAECLSFALFLKIEGEYVEFIPAKVSISDGAMQALDDALVEELWMRVEDSQAYFEFTEGVIRKLVEEESLDPYEKGAALYSHSASATRHLLCALPETLASAHRLESISKGLCDFLELHQFSFTRLMVLWSRSGTSCA